MQKTFTQRDIERAVRGALKGGISLGRIEILPNGGIVLWSTEETDGFANDLERELDQWKMKNGAH